MERFPAELGHQLRQRGNVRLGETTIHGRTPSGSRWISRLDRQLSVLLRYPVHARRRRQSADVFHIVDHAYAHLTRSLPPNRTVVTCHDLMLLHAERENIGFRGTRAAVWRFRWLTSFLSDAGVIACDSEATADDVSDLIAVQPSRLRVIPLGVSSVFRKPAEAERLEVRRRLDPTGTRPIVIHVSTGGGYKNTPTTLRVLHALRARDVDAILVRVGVPLSRDGIELARTLGVADRIREFHGISDEALASLYGAADVLLFPSLWEGFGWPPVEALACGTPSVIAAECRSVVDLVGDAALAVAGTDVAALTAAVERILTDESIRRELAERGRPRIEALTWERTAEGYERAYEHLATASGARLR